MFRRQNLRWTLPAVALVCVAVGIAVLLSSRQASTARAAVRDTGMAQAVAIAVTAAAEPAPPAGLTVQGLVGQMQGRANAIGGLEGVLGVQMTLPAQGAWKGMPFRYRAPDAFVELTGTKLTTPDGAPVSQDNAWRLFRAGEVYVRADGQTMKLMAGRDYKGLSYGDDAEALLLANLMPAAWFGAFTKDLRVAPDETVAGVSYHVLVDQEIMPARGQTMMRYEHNNEMVLTRQYRRARKYYVNATTLMCDRMVLGRQKLEWGGAEKDPFLGATMDVVASDVGAAGGGQLPMTYTKRYYGTTGVYQAQALTLQGMAGKGPSSFAASDFDPKGLTPGQKPVVLRPMDRMEDLEKLAEGKNADAGLFLTLADDYTLEDDLKPAEEMLQKADALAPDGDYAVERAAIWGALEPKTLARDLNDEPQMQRIYTERAARLRALGDDVHGAQMEAKASEHASALARAQARAQALKITAPVGTGGSK